MTPQEYEQMMQNQSVAGQVSDTATKQMIHQYQMEEREKGVVEMQLKLDEEIERIDNLLRGRIEKKINGQKMWVDPVDPDLVILTEYGIQLILNAVAWYINKNTLLSNYDAHTILVKMRDFSSALNKTIFMEYHKVFKQPTIQECKDLIRANLKKKVDLRMFTLEMMGIRGDAKQIEADMIEQVEEKIEREMIRIRSELSKQRLTRYLLLIREVQDAVHSTYNRAFQGMERKTLREHVQVTETKGGMPIQQQSKGLFSWLTG